MLLGTTGTAQAATPAGSPIGNVDAVIAMQGGVRVRGWAWDANTSQAVTVVLHSGAATQRIAAVLHRPDVARAFPAAGASRGFDVVLPTPGGPQRVCITALDVGPGNDRQLACRTVTVPDRAPVGNLDSVTPVGGGVRVRGWASDPDTTEPLGLRVTTTGAVHPITTGASRPDVLRSHLGLAANTGFDAVVPLASGTHEVCVTVVGVGTGGDRRLGCRTATVEHSAVSVALLQPEADKAALYAAGGADLVTLELGWDAYEPVRARFGGEYRDRQLAAAAKYADAGLEVVLDLGLQYPPTWAWGLPGATRFVNQYGREWHGGIGTDVLNAVWNPAVRQAQAVYIRQVAADFRGRNLTAVRLGGLLSGEIRLPPAHYEGKTDSLWGFDPIASAASPIPGWRPGAGTPTEAGLWLDFYLNSLTEYQVWLATTVADAFPGVPLDVLMPGWGVRPGAIETVSNALASTAAVEATGDDLSSGLDWARQVPALAATGIDVTLVTTWLDAPSYGPAARDQAPVEFLAGLASEAGLPVSGENTGGNDRAALARVVEQAERFALDRVTWMSAPALTAGTGLSLLELTAALRGR